MPSDQCEPGSASPDFASTSPFFLKLSIAIVHVSSMMMLLQGSSSAALPVPDAPPPLSVSGSVAHLNAVLFDQHQGVFGAHLVQQQHAESPSGTASGSTCHTTSSMWHELLGSRTGMAVVHRIMGGQLFATLPIMFALLAVAACLLPVVAIVTPPKSTHRRTVIGMAVSSVVYCVFCLHAGISVSHYLLSTGPDPVLGGRSRVLLSTMCLHAATHMLYQTGTRHSKLLLARYDWLFPCLHAKRVQTTPPSDRIGCVVCEQGGAEVCPGQLGNGAACDGRVHLVRACSGSAQPSSEYGRYRVCEGACNPPPACRLLSCLTFVVCAGHGDSARVDGVRARDARELIHGLLGCRSCSYRGGGLVFRGFIPRP